MFNDFGSSFSKISFIIYQRITDEIKQGSIKRGSSEDFVQIIQKHFDGKLSAVETDELQVDTGSCFRI